MGLLEIGENYRAACEAADAAETKVGEARRALQSAHEELHAAEARCADLHNDLVRTARGRAAGGLCPPGPSSPPDAAPAAG